MHAGSIALPAAMSTQESGCPSARPTGGLGIKHGRVHSKKPRPSDNYFPLSIEADCLTNFDMGNGVRKLPYSKAILYYPVRQIEYRFKRKVCVVETKFGTMWADRNTGSLYHFESGIGLTGGRIEIGGR